MSLNSETGFEWRSTAEYKNGPELTEYLRSISFNAKITINLTENPKYFYFTFSIMDVFEYKNCHAMISISKTDV